MKVLFLILFLLNSLAGAFATCCCDSPIAQKQTAHGCCAEKTEVQSSLDADQPELPDTATGTHPSCGKSCCQILFLGNLAILEKQWTEGGVVAAQGKMPPSFYKDSLTPPPRA